MSYRGGLISGSNGWARPAGYELFTSKPTISSDAIAASCALFGLSFAMDADGVLVNGRRFATLLDADAHLEEIAMALGERAALIDAAQ